jgi:signal transduction histidine kinase
MKQYSLIFYLLAWLLAPAGAEAGVADKLALYLYEDTKQLVTLVEDAAGIMEKQGAEAFKRFGAKGSRWLNKDYYLFVYDLEGTCLFHPISPELVGKNLIRFKDMNGKPVIRLITDVGRKAQRDAGGWGFYLWEEGTQFVPRWKSSYIRKVIGPDNRIYLIGSGSYNIKIEKSFIQENVNAAARLLETKGRKIAFTEFRNSGSVFHLLDTYIFVMDDTGRTLVDPAFPMLVNRDLKDFQDAVGRYVVKEVFRKLEQSDEAWIQYLWPKPESILPSRKLAYFRKVKVGHDTLIVGSDFFMATPIWMKL